MASPGKGTTFEGRQSSTVVFNIADACKANPQSNFILNCESSPSPVAEKVRTNNCDNIMFRSSDLLDPAPVVHNNFMGSKTSAAENEDSESDAVEIGVRIPRARSNQNKFGGGKSKHPPKSTACNKQAMEILALESRILSNPTR